MTRLTILLVLTGLASVLPGCSSPTDLARCGGSYQRPDRTALTQQLTTARARWTAAKIWDYRFQYTLTGFVLPRPLNVTVRDGQIVSVEPVGPDQGSGLPLAGETVEQKFDNLSAGLSQLSSASCPVFNVSYDPLDGHPTELWSGEGSPQVADGLGGWRIEAFTRL